MAPFLAVLMFILLLAIAIAHAVWAFGGSWPIRNRAMLAQTVIGVEGVTRVPRLASFGVAIAVMLAGIAALALADHTSGKFGLDAIGIVLALVFLGRGAIGYTRWWQQKTPLEPFRTLDRRNFSPLCLGLGAGFLILVVLRFI
jgi:uncharacterized membrane protein YidH (DUF202 family)